MQSNSAGQNMNNGLGEGYTSLVRAVYIDPIRSVVVVDDDFPTLDSLLATAGVHDVAIAEKSTNSLSKSQLADRAPRTAGEAVTATAAPTTEMQPYVSMRFKGRMEEVSRVQSLIAACRQRTRPWLVDVHDGQPGNGSDELDIAPYLHHSDLMILDYHLRGNIDGGDRAIEILRKLASNDHFNLVIVYTKGVHGDIRKVYEEISLGLLSQDGFEYDEERAAAVESLIADWEDESDDGIQNKLKDVISAFSYVKLRIERDPQEKDAINQQIKGLLANCPADVVSRSRDIEGRAESVRLDISTLVEWAMVQKHQELLPNMSQGGLDQLQCAFSEDANWIRTENLFVTVINKDHQPAELEGLLVNALNAWAPGPHQLLMGKMRAEIDEQGAAAEAEVLSDKQLQAGWLRELLLQAEDKDRVVKHSIDRHWEALGDQIRPQVEIFAKDLCHIFHSADRSTIEGRYIDSNITQADELAHLNCYYSTKPVDRSHLTTGHVFKFDADDVSGQEEYWVCLSPACDLVPGQKTGGWHDRLGGALPFMAVQLKPVGLEEALQRVNENRFVFIRTRDKVLALTFVASSQITTNPVWEQMFAKQGGSFVEGKSGIVLTRMKQNDGGLSAFDYHAEVVCQLRYEYALNLLQRLGGSLSRIGLDFRNMPKDGKKNKSPKSNGAKVATLPADKSQTASSQATRTLAAPHHENSGVGDVAAPPPNAANDGSPEDTGVA